MEQEIYDILCESRNMFDRELDSFVPQRVFDAHFEFWIDSMADTIGVTIPTRFEDIRPACDLLHPGREVRAALIPYTFQSAQVSAVNEASAREAARSGGSCSTYFFVRPDD